MVVLNKVQETSPKLSLEWKENSVTLHFAPPDTDAVQDLLPQIIKELERRLSRPQYHPIFMPRNDEELIRNLIALSSEIKYVRDLPQASIHYEKQTETDLTFTVIAARLRKPKMESLKATLDKANPKVEIEDFRNVGSIQKYPKEAAIFRMTIGKAPFFRADYSLDLLKARQRIANELTRILGEYRDYNGGMIFKQSQALKSLRHMMGELSQDKAFILENYFYALKPAISQTVLDPDLLERHFSLLLSALSSEEKNKTLIEGPFILHFTLYKDSGLKKKMLAAIAALHLSSHDLTHAFFRVGSFYAAGFIVRTNDPERFLNALQSAGSRN